MENSIRHIEKDEDFYEKRQGVENVGIKYQHTLAVLFATRLTLDNNVANFKLSMDNKRWYDFDDIVLEIAYCDDTQETFAIQVKQTKNAEKFTEKDFCTPNKKGYRLPDYYKGFEKSDLVNENLIISTTSHFNDSANKDITRIFDFTKVKKLPKEEEQWANVVLKMETNQVGLEDKRKFLFACKENMNVSKFIVTQGGHDLNKLFFGKLTLILNQNKLEDIEKLINDEINTYFQITESEAATSLISFVEIAVKNLVVVDGNIRSFKMTKRDFLIRISELLLKSYIEKPLFQKENFDVKTEILFNETDEIVTLDELLHIWDQFIACSDVTVINNPDDSVKKNIWTIFSELVKRDSECEISDNSRRFREQIIQILKKYCKSENLGMYKKNVLLQLLLVYWYNGKSTIVLNDEEEPENLYKLLPKIIDLFHFQKINPKMILLSNSNRNIDLSGKCKIVSRLEHIKNLNTPLYEEIINKVPLNIQDRFKCTISKLDERVVQFITSRNLLEIILQKYKFGGSINELNVKPLLENYFDRKLEKVMLKKEVLNEEQDLFIVHCPESTPNLETIRKPNVAITHNINDNRFNNVKNQNRDKNVHFLGYNSNQCESYFEHIKTYGSMTNIRKHSIGIHISDTDLLKITTSDRDPFRPFRPNISLITAPPGMGKTSLLHRWTKICPKNFWALMVSLNKSSEKFYSEEFKVEVYLEKIITETYDDLSKAVLNIFLERKKVVIFLDGFDEISPHYCEKVIEIIEFFNIKRQCSQIVTTRECVTEKIQRPYNIFTFTLLPFDTEGQKTYLNYLGDNETAACTHNETEKLIDTLKINFDEKFIGMPLILNMIWKVFKNHKFKIENLDEISLIQQYVDVEIRSSYREKFFKGITVGNVEIVNKINSCMEMTELVAMNLFFGKEKFMEIYQNDINKFVSSIKEGVEKLGNIIDIGENATPVFIHRLIAEYLAALWLKENGKKQPELIPHLFQTEKVIIRHLFDKLSSKGKEIHGAILDDNLDKVKLLLKSGGIDQADQFGRSALHLACSWGVRCNIPSADKTFNSESYFETVQNEFKNSGKIIQTLHGSGPNKLVKVKDDILEYDCIDYAAKTCSLRTVEYLLRENCLNTVSLDNFPKESIAYYCTVYNFPCIMHATFDGTDFQEFFTKTRYCSNLDIQDIKNLLHVASEYGSIDIIDFCLKNTENIVDLCDNIQQTALHYAARGATRNHLKILKCLLDYNANINSQNYFGDTPLHSSASLGNAKSIELLLKYGANVNIKNNNRCTPIFNAIEKKQEHIFSFLLEKQLQINLTNHEGDTILHLASQGNLTSLVKQIISIFKNVNVNSKNVKRKTALHYAAENGNLAIVKLLIAKKVDINWQDNKGNTALHLATQKNRCDIVKILCKYGADTEIPNSIGQTPLLIAVKEGLNLDNLSVLKENNPRIVCEDSLRNTALHVAIKSGCDIIVDELIQKRMDEKNLTDLNSMNALRKRPIHLAIEKNNFALYKKFKEILGDKIEFDNNSESLLMVAVRNECKEIINDLLQTNLDVNFKNVDGKTALNLAIKTKNYCLYKRLIELGADIHSRDNRRNTLLHKSVKYNVIEIIDDLLEKGINLNLKNRFGRTSLYYAVRKNDRIICNKLLKYEALTNLKDLKGDTILHLVVRNNYRGLFAEMVENERDKWRQINLDAINRIGMSAIFLAIEYNNFEMYIKLKNKCANLFLTDIRGYSLLHMCSAFGRKEIMIDLLHSGLDANSRDLSGKTPLLTAIECNSNEIFFYLIERGIDVNVTDIDENTPLHIAFKYQHNSDIIKYLVQKMSLNVKNLIGQTPIHAASKWGDEEIFSKIDRSKFDANITDNFGNTALHLALISSRKKIVEWILKETKLDKNGVLKINCKGRNCIHYAAMYQNETFFQSLKNCVAADESQKVILEERINDKDYPRRGNSGWKSPLQYLKERNFERERLIIRTLIELGARETPLNSTSTLQDSVKLDGKTSLHKAVISGSLEDVKKLLIEHADPNIPDIQGRRPIHDSVEDVAKLEILKQLCRFEANVNLRDHDGVSALLLSLKHKNIAAYEILKENNVDLSVKDKSGNTALHVALQYDANFAVIDLLNHNKRNLYCKNNAGKMAIEWVVENKNFELYKNHISNTFHDKNLILNNQKKNSQHMARYILSKLLLVAIKCKADKFFWHLIKCHEARFDFEDENGNSPLQAAIESKNYASHEYILPHVMITFENHMQENLLHIAVKSGAREIVKNLLEKKRINIDDMNVIGKSSLHMAIENISKKTSPDLSSIQNYDSDVNCNAWNSSSMCDMLLENGADINLRDIFKNTPLHLAIEKDNCLVRELLLNKDNVDINAVNCEGKTAIFLAVEKQNFELYKTLKGKGAKLDVIDKFGFTLLHAAVSKNFSDPVEDLIESSPFIMNQKDFKGRSPILLAIEMGYIEMYEKLKRLGGNVKETDCGRNSALHLALTYSRLEIFRDLISLGLDMNAKNLIGKTPMHCIVKQQQDGDKYLLYAAETKFDPNLMDNYGNTPLHLAINKRNKKAIEWLIKSKSDLYLTNCRGRNAIHFAAQHRVAEFFDYVQELDERINDEDFIGKTPLQFARESGSKIIEEKLISLGATDVNK